MKPGRAKPGTAAPSWRVVGASVQGENHRRNGKPCQDAHRWQEDNGVLIAAVADGAGSAAHAEIGATIALQAAVRTAASRLRLAFPRSEKDWRVLLRLSLQAARQDLENRAANLDISPPELATTCLLAVATPELLAAAQVGDGAVVARLADGTLSAVTHSSQEYVNETTFLTSAGFIDRAQYVVRPGAVTGLALLTDGLQMLALRMPQGEPHAGFFDPLLRLLADTPERDPAAARLRRFLQSSPIAQRADDDLTLILAVRME